MLQVATANRMPMKKTIEPMSIRLSAMGRGQGLLFIRHPYHGGINSPTAHRIPKPKSMPIKGGK